MLCELKVLRESDKSKIILVQDSNTEKKYVQKILKGEHPVYQKLQRLDSSYIPHIESVYYEDGNTIVLEEFIEGKSLDQLDLSGEDLILPFIELCVTLESLHRHDIIHRDIRPDHILLAPDGHIRLIDFDAAREWKPLVQQDTRLLGTKGFAAPEQYGFAQTDARTDIYALGVTLKILLGSEADQPPYQSVINKCLELDPARRYRSAEELSGALFLCMVYNISSQPSSGGIFRKPYMIPLIPKKFHGQFFRAALKIYDVLFPTIPKPLHYDRKATR